MVEARFLEKYKGLVMYDADLETTLTVYDGILEVCGSRGWG